MVVARESMCEPCAIQFASDDCLDDKEIALAAVEAHGCALEHFSDDCMIIDLFYLLSLLAKVGLNSSLALIQCSCHETRAVEFSCSIGHQTCPRLGVKTGSMH